MCDQLCICCVFGFLGFSEFSQGIPPNSGEVKQDDLLVASGGVASCQDAVGASMCHLSWV